MSHLYKVIPLAKNDRMIHLDNHTYRGVEIIRHATGYKAEFGDHRISASSWIAVEKKIDEILKDKNN